MTHLETVSEVVRGVSYKKSDAADRPGPGFIPILRATNIGQKLTLDDELVFVPEHYVRVEQRVRPGDIIVASSSGSSAVVGKSAILDRPWNGSFGAFCCLIRAKDGVDPRYLGYYLQNRPVRERWSAAARGTSINNLKRSDVESTPVPLAPLAEQRRIVAAIEEQFSRIDAGVTALQRARRNLQRMRVAVLQAAVEGRLTEEWRAEHPDVDPASVLLEGIWNERYRISKEYRAAKQPGREQRLRAKWRSRSQEFASSDTLGLPELPKGWSWARMELLSTSKSNAICAGPFGTIFKARDFRPSGVPIIFLRHVSAGRYLTDRPGFMDTAKWEDLFQPYSVYGGELLITKMGDPPGACAVYPDGIGPAMVTPDVIKMSVNDAAADKHYLKSYLNSQLARRLAHGAAFGTTRLRVTLPIFRHLPVPVPPLAEQREIVAEVDRRLSVVGEVEKQLDAGLKRSGRLRQSILMRAFAGRLVSQDPSDEPASTVLGSILNERRGQTTSRTGFSQPRAEPTAEAHLVRKSR